MSRIFLSHSSSNNAPAVALRDWLTENGWEDEIFLDLDPQHGRLTSVAVTDHGEEQLVLQGRPLTAHHYSIRTSFPQELWYDQHRRLVQVELNGSDGSKIEYQPG